MTAQVEKVNAHPGLLELEDCRPDTCEDFLLESRRRREFFLDVEPASPGLFTPVIRSGTVVVDGGVVNPVPVSMCRAMGADLVIAVDLSWGKLGPYRDRAKRTLHLDKGLLAGMSA